MTTLGLISPGDMGASVGAAAAIKMVFAANTKGSLALLAALLNPHL